MKFRKLFYFDDHVIASMEKRRKPVDGGSGTAQPKLDLAHCLGSDRIAARHGAAKADEVIEAANVKFLEYKCAR